VKRLLAGVNWKAFAVLLVAGLLGVVGVLPYMMELVGRSIFGQEAASDVPMPLVLTLALLQNGILLAVTILIGLVLSERIGFCGRWWRTPGGLPTSRAFWIAIVLFAVLFGLGHLPATSAIAPLTTMLVL
jgi:hypothetical protein